MAGRRALAAALILLVIGSPVLLWLADQALITGNPWVLMLVPPVIALLFGIRPARPHPAWGLAALALIAVFCWAAGWSLVLPAAAVLLTVPLLDRTSGRLWLAAGTFATVLAALGQLGVARGWLPTVVDPVRSHVAAGLLLTTTWATLAVVAQDAERRHRSERELERADARLRALMESSTDVLAVATAEGMLTYVSPAVARSMGYAASDLQGCALADIVDPEHQAGVSHRLQELLARGPDARAALDALLVHASLERRWYELSFHNLLHDPLVNGVVIQMRDVSERLEAQRDLAHAASHDDLTGLPNRGELLRRMSLSLPQAGPSAAVAVLFVDLDLFKDVNDRLGHQAGDDVLTVVARRLAASIRTHDYLGRLGGDEFGVLLTEVRDEREVKAVISRLVDAIERPIALPAGTVQVGASIGYALTTDPATQLDRLLATADRLMYRDKSRRR